MPALNWDAFASLQGSAQRNFETLCRSVIRYSFGSYGVLRARANQPGVEFHLKLDRPNGTLGEVGRWWGWQCKWYGLPAGRALGQNRRDDIEDSIQKTETHVPGVTDFVLWTRRPLTSGDQDWFLNLSSTMTLHLWTEDDIEAFLVGQASVLLGTYFGELVLTPEILLERHEEAVAPIRARWQPEVHHVFAAERELRRMLGESDSWSVLRDLAADLHSQVMTVEAEPQPPSPFAEQVKAVILHTNSAAESLGRVADEIHDGDLDLLRDNLAASPISLPPNATTLLRRLRAGNHRAGPYVTNAVAGLGESLELLADVEASFSTRIVAVLAPAGCGKTQLAAQLTAGTERRPSGLLIHGHDLHANHSLDDLAKRVSIAAQPVPSMESLLAALNAAGERARHRLPMVIDGLNEAEDPRKWKGLLAGLELTLAKYPYVLVVCTLRREFADEVLPAGTPSVEIEGYGEETIEAVREHFEFWKIDATDVLLPSFLQHPLTLRLFCEVTNPTRERVVGISTTPGSLTALFARYLDQVGDRISALAPPTHRYIAEDVRSALLVIGNRLWDSRSRFIDMDELRQALGDKQRPWDQSLVRALEHEGVMLRTPSLTSIGYVPAYDRLGGHLIADSLLATTEQADFEQIIRDPATTVLLTGAFGESHPLADDIVHALVGQVPRRFVGRHLWHLVDEPLRSTALRDASRLEAAYLDSGTIKALLDLASQGETGIIVRLREVRGADNHPLNAQALDSLLRPMAVSERDLYWTEWLRANDAEVLRDLQNLESRWRRQATRTGDRLRARWTMWNLTSTVRQIRDQATCALYWFGRIDPVGLFALTLDSLSVNDPYVGERMLAATYGVAMSHQLFDIEFEQQLGGLLSELTTGLMHPDATAPSSHFLVRRYVQGLVAFATKFYGGAVPDNLQDSWTFSKPAPVPAMAASDPRADEMGQTLHMDFRNYTLGRLFPGRRNYDMDHEGHQKAVAHVLGVVWSLGWREEAFGKIDQAIANDGFRDRGDRPRAERYGKKYGWIGFFTYAGILEEDGGFSSSDRPFSDVDIDPSFPERPLADGEAFIGEAWLAPSLESHELWMRESTTSLPRSLLVRQRIGEHDGPWIVAHGFVKAEDRVLGREVWAFVSAMLVSKKNAARLVTALEAGVRPWAARDVPRDYYTFAGEIPWHPNFAGELIADSGPGQAYREHFRTGTADFEVEVEVLAHGYAWESYHSELNEVGNVRVPSRSFSDRFDLRSAPQNFDQFLPDGTKATVTLEGIDGLDGDLLYIREDLLREYAGLHSVVWFAFGERELSPFSLARPEWHVDAQQHRENAWHEVLTEADLKAI